MPSFIPLGKYRIEYLDGETEEIRSNFGAIMELEAELPDKDTPDGTVLLYGMWLYKGRPEGDPKEWGRNIFNITPVTDDAKSDTDPSPPPAGPD